VTVPVKRQPSIHRRLVRTLAAFGSVPVLVFGVLVAAGDYAVRLRHGADVVEAVGTAAAEELSLHLASHRGAIQQLADRFAAQGEAAWPPAPQALASALGRTSVSFPGFLTLLATDAQGRVVGGWPGRQADGSPFTWAGVDVSDRGYFRVPRETGQPFLTGVFIGRGFGNDRMAAASAPIVLDDGRFLGVVQGAIRLDALDRLMSVTASQPGLELLVVDPSMRVAFASPGVPFAVHEQLPRDGWLDGGAHDAARFVPLRLPGAPAFDSLAFERDTPEGWHVVVLTSRWHLLSRAMIDLGLVMLLMVLVVLAALQAGRLQGRRVTEPLRELGRRLDSLSLAEDPAIPATRSEVAELATLEESFARMAGRITEHWSRLQDELATEAMLREELARTMAQRRAMDAELSIAAEIQQSMVPGRDALASKVPQLEVAALLEPARAVGGDFFNVIPVDDQYTCFYVGDVSDKGVAAALFMARVATLLEVAARRGEPPGKVLSIVARQVARDNPSEMFATVLCGVVDVHIGTLSLASAGHDPPAILRADGRVDRLPMETGAALGFDPDAEYPEWHLRLKPGDTVVCWTDGLTEAPDAAGREFGESALRDCLADARGTGAQAVMDRLLAAVRAHLGEQPPHDDLTLLALRRPAARALPAPAASPTRPPIELEMPNRLAVLPVLSAALDGALADEAVPEPVRKDIALVLEEVLSNTVRHGYGEGQRDIIRLTARRDGDRLYLRFDDGAMAWNPLEHELPDLDAEIEDREVGGLGVLLVRELSESAQYQRVEGRNRLDLVIRLEAPEEVTA
jgi:serine phosphatase RsbU (regulator of sigma subunit)/anti-sigma regulatory factor (Ser/Thr protein kinase)